MQKAAIFTVHGQSTEGRIDFLIFLLACIFCRWGFIMTHPYMISMYAVTIHTHHHSLSCPCPFVKMIFFFVVLGLELRTYTWIHSTKSFLMKGFSKITSSKLFALAGFEL
jgi:hypothetical protein